MCSAKVFRGLSGEKKKKVRKQETSQRHKQALWPKAGTTLTIKGLLLKCHQDKQVLQVPEL